MRIGRQFQHGARHTMLSYLFNCTDQSLAVSLIAVRWLRMPQPDVGPMCGQGGKCA